MAVAPAWALATAAATGVAVAAWPHPALAAGHSAAGATALLACVARLAFDHVRALYRTAYGRWALGVCLLGALLALHATGAALAPGEAGAEGRAHLGAGPFSPPTAADALAGHALLLAPLALALGLLLASAEAGAAQRRATTALAVLLAAAPLAAAPALARGAVVPEIDGAETGRAPWALRALEPIEAGFGVPAAGIAMLVALAALVLLPLADRGGGRATRALVTCAFALLLVAYAMLSFHSAFAPVADHFHAVTKVSP